MSVDIGKISLNHEALKPDNSLNLMHKNRRQLTSIDLNPTGPEPVTCGLESLRTVQ